MGNLPERDLAQGPEHRDNPPQESAEDYLARLEEIADRVVDQAERPSPDDELPPS